MVNIVMDEIKLLDKNIILLKKKELMTRKTNSKKIFNREIYKHCRHIIFQKIS